MMRVVIAPDSFKESLSAAGVADAIALGVRDAAPDAEVICVPMADGGEGSLDAVLDATGGERRSLQVRDAIGRPCQASWGWLGEGRAFVEMAAAAGLENIAPEDRDALRASTFGVGQLIWDAVQAGARHIVLGLGGSATNDAGAGLLQARGVRLLDGQGQDLPPGGIALSRLAGIDSDGVDPRLAEVQFEIAVDVDNPLCGPRGASAIFGPQKGASPEDVRALDEALAHFADVCARHFGKDERDLPGMGAAGGLGFAVKACFDARFRPGVELIAELAGLDAALEGADLVFTGEGRMDAQTVLGKTPVGVARHARPRGIPVIAIVGALGNGYEAVYAEGITAAFSLAPGPITLEQACANAAALLRQRVGDCMRLLRAGAEGLARR
jgi:glycerate kinase